MTIRHKTKIVRIGDIAIGGNHPIAIQSMTNTDTRDARATAEQIAALAAGGCEIVRVAVPDRRAAEALKEIKRRMPRSLPLVADIHFDYRLALLAIQNGADKLRLNPGNIGGADRIKQVARAAKEQGVPIRVGVNAGSLEKDLLARYGVCARAMTESALRHVRLLEDCGFDGIVIALKASSVPLCVEAYEAVAQSTEYPLHIGVTEAGTVHSGSVKSAAGIGAILSRGLGDTIRVSLTGDPREEVRCAQQILQALELRRFGVELISCPTCGRTEIDLIRLTNEIEARCRGLGKNIKVAVMGCAVNGPGEARDADIGVAGGKGVGVLFRKGKAFRTVPEPEIIRALMDEIERCEIEGCELE
ncbi:MAG: flavodoxin-dependent (E)-4-hydroxy-3-methylbut-2-enyl-diphosphate synthase [Clostridiales bacterium]|jgi:(E)-4-hydroxy-3-methylbut-2-enyl-diphosphate synthase|nr:flavodoxin-dependent (E)-4-hydroxy-3-methylbut-2-enyl-diphosphate synthase [Clostridiales bacterium]